MAYRRCGPVEGWSIISSMSNFTIEPVAATSDDLITFVENGGTLTGQDLINFKKQGWLTGTHLQTLVEIGSEKNTTVVFPLPIDILSGIIKGSGNANVPPQGPTS